MKKTDKYKNITYFKPKAKDTMQEAQEDSYCYVKISEYKKLIQELECERNRLKKAGVFIGELKRKLSN